MMQHPMIGVARIYITIPVFPGPLRLLTELSLRHSRWLPACACALMEFALSTKGLLLQAAARSEQHADAGEPPRLVAVPTHFFKAVLAEKHGAGNSEQALVGAWVMPNAAVRVLPLVEAFLPLAVWLQPRCYLCVWGDAD